MPPDLQYYHVIEMHFRLADQTIPVFTKPGIPSWDNISPSVTLLADSLDLFEIQKMFLVGFGHGALVVYFAQKMGQGLLVATDDYFLSHQLTEKTLIANGFTLIRTDQQGQLF
jgi:16S rRNA G1207 methylase RsmC